MLQANRGPGEKAKIAMRVLLQIGIRQANLKSQEPVFLEDALTYKTSFGN